MKYPNLDLRKIFLLSLSLIFFQGAQAQDVAAKVQKVFLDEFANFKASGDMEMKELDDGGTRFFRNYTAGDQELEVQVTLLPAESRSKMQKVLKKR